MFVCSVRAASVKFLTAVCLSLAVLITLVALIPPAGASSAEEAAAIRYADIEENSDRLAFIGQFGWQVEETPLESVAVTVPAAFDSVYLGYNDMQKAQGMNLQKYAGKTVTRYTYKVLNYPDYDGTVYISLLIYRDKVVGGDVCSADVAGFVHGFALPDAAE